MRQLPVQKRPLHYALPDDRDRLLLSRVHATRSASSRPASSLPEALAMLQAPCRSCQLANWPQFAIDHNRDERRTMSPPRELRVLSLQSHVVYGYVGNKSATFPMQLHGLEVDPLNTVQFSTHSGYPVVRGQRMDGEQLDTLIEGLEANGILEKYTHVITGYIGSVSLVRTLARVVRDLKRRNPDLMYVCDPVMGDEGKLYVPQEMVPAFRDEIVPLADVLTPNQFELEQLTGKAILSEADAIAAIDFAHSQLGVKSILVTSTEYDSSEIFVIGSTKGGELFSIAVPRLSTPFSGAGDLCTALTLVWHTVHKEPLISAAEKVVATIQAVLARTMRAGQEELCLIQSKTDLEQPVVTIRARIIDRPVV